MESKICKICQLDIPLSGFTIYNKVKNKLRTYCKVCEKEKKRVEYLKNFNKYSLYKKEYVKLNTSKVKAYKKTWYEDNKLSLREKSKASKKEYRENNRVKIKEKARLYNLNNQDKKKAYYEANKERIKLKQKEYRKNNWSKVRGREKLAQIEKRKDPFYRLKDAIRHRINVSIKNNGYTKKSKTYQILGCTFEEFKAHLESKFEPWMNWSNYGKYNGTANYGWDIDHILPLKTGRVEEDITKLNHYTNLQPLCSYYNRNIKRDITM